MHKSIVGEWMGHWVILPALPLTSYVTLSTSLNLSGSLHAFLLFIHLRSLECKLF